MSQSQRDSDKEQEEDDIPSLTPEKGVSSESLPDISPSCPGLVSNTEIENGNSPYDENELVCVLNQTVSNFEINSPEIEIMSDSDDIIPYQWFDSPMEEGNNSWNDNIDEQWFDSPFSQELAKHQ